MSEKNYLYDGLTLTGSSDDGYQYRIKIMADPDPEDPRVWDNSCTMRCWYSNYKLGDATELSAREYLLNLIHLYTDLTDENVDGYSNIELIDVLQKSDKIYIKPLSLYDHSGITISTATHSYPYNDRWDSSIVGFIYMPADKVPEIKGKTKDEVADELIEGEVAIYDLYLRGEVYGFIFEKKVIYKHVQYDMLTKEELSAEESEEWIHIDSCYGFYGLTLEDVDMQSYWPIELTNIREVK